MIAILLMKRWRNVGGSQEIYRKRQNMKKILRLIWVCTLLIGGVSAWAGPLSLTQEQTGALRHLIKTNAEAASQFQELKKTADAALNNEPDPIPSIATEGKLANDPEKIRTLAALKDMRKIDALAWTWLITGEQQYAQKGKEFILSWAEVNKSDGDPINETNLEPLLVGYDILRGQFSSSEQRMVDAWLSGRAYKLWLDPRGHNGNWQSHRLKITGMIAAEVGDDALWRDVESGFDQQLAVSFLPNGAATDFQLRDSLHYDLYSLDPMLTLACVAHQRSENWYAFRAQNGASLKDAVQFVVPYALGKQTHIEFAHSKIKFDRQRAHNGESEYQPHAWNVCESRPVFSNAGCVDPNAQKVAVELPCNGSHERFFDWNSVLNAVRAGAVE